MMNNLTWVQLIKALYYYESLKIILLLWFIEHYITMYQWRSGTNLELVNPILKPILTDLALKQELLNLVLKLVFEDY